MPAGSCVGYEPVYAANPTADATRLNETPPISNDAVLEISRFPRNNKHGLFEATLLEGTLSFYASFPISEKCQGYIVYDNEQRRGGKNRLISPPSCNTDCIVLASTTMQDETQTRNAKVTSKSFSSQSSRKYDCVALDDERVLLARPIYPTIIYRSSSRKKNDFSPFILFPRPWNSQSHVNALFRRSDDSFAWANDDKPTIKKEKKKMKCHRFPSDILLLQTKLSEKNEVVKWRKWNIANN